MKEQMTSKERLLTAIRLEQPDMVPVTPDISSMIPCKLTGKPFWDTHLYENPNPTNEFTNPALGRAYLKALDHFKFDGWYMYGGLHLKTNSQVSSHMEIISKTDDRIIMRTVYNTPKGELTQQDVFYRDNSPTRTEKVVKDIEKDFEKIKYFYPDILGYDDSFDQPIREELGDKGIFCYMIGYPGFQDWIFLFNGNLEAMTYAYYDHQDIMDEWRYIQDRFICRQTEMILDAKPDVLFLGGSGTITLQSPDIFRRLGLPTIKKVTHMAKEAGVPTMLHSCGKARKLVEILADETDLNCINPLEKPPMGDCILKDIKEQFGDKIALMGNLHTTEVMLMGTVEDVERAAKQAIDDTAKGGGFILSTGDQCGRDTPEENIFKMIEVARTYGRY
jgi:uroporphyrinogen decarboxylase